MPNPSGKINERERGICSRVRTFREAIRYSQSDFAKQLGITRDRLAGIEYCRTPLQYEVAWKIRLVFGVSLSWLADESFPPQAEDLEPWPDPNTLKKGQLLSDVEKSLWAESPDKPHAGELHKKLPFQAPRRSTLLSILKDDLTDWLARVPDDKISDFTGQLVTLAEDFLGKVPKEPSAKIKQRKVSLVWDTMRLDIEKRLLGKSTESSNLTNPATSVKHLEVKPQLPSLLQRLNRATEQTGKMSALADFLKVPLASVSRWLSGKREPGGEITLKMLHWVEQQERQK